MVIVKSVLECESCGEQVTNSSFNADFFHMCADPRCGIEICENDNEECGIKCSKCSKWFCVEHIGDEDLCGQCNGLNDQ